MQKFKDFIIFYCIFYDIFQSSSRAEYFSASNWDRYSTRHRQDSRTLRLRQRSWKTFYGGRTFYSTTIYAFIQLQKYVFIKLQNTFLTTKDAFIQLQIKCISLWTTFSQKQMMFLFNYNTCFNSTLNNYYKSNQKLSLFRNYFSWTFK